MFSKWSIHFVSGQLLFHSQRNGLTNTYTRDEGGQRPPSSLVRVADATLISSEEVVF